MTTDLLAAVIPDLLHGSAIRTQTIGQETIRGDISAHGFPEEGERRKLVPLLRHEALQHLPFMIHRPPQVMGPAVNLHHHLIDVPTPLGVLPHEGRALTLDRPREERAEPLAPETDTLMGHVDPAPIQQILDVPKAQRIPDIHQHRELDHVAGRLEIAKRIFGHPRQQGRFDPTKKPDSSDNAVEEIIRVAGGERGIRTLGTLARSTVFETAPFDHSGTSPRGAFGPCRAVRRAGVLVAIPAPCNRFFDT